MSVRLTCRRRGRMVRCVDGHDGPLSSGYLVVARDADTARRFAAAFRQLASAGDAAPRHALVLGSIVEAAWQEARR